MWREAKIFTALLFYCVLEMKDRQRRKIQGCLLLAVIWKNCKSGKHNIRNECIWKDVEFNCVPDGDFEINIPVVFTVC